MAQLCQHSEEFSALNTHIAVISFSRPDQARLWLHETNAPFALLLDPQRRAYRAYGLEYSLRRSWGLNVVRRYGQLLMQGRKWRGIQGDSGQLGGDFIVDSDGVVRFGYRSRDPTDRPPAANLLAFLSAG